MISSIALPLLCFIGVIVGLSATDEWYENTGYNKYLLESVPGEVKAGKYFHYSLNYQGPLSLYLTSKTGDADFYVSTSVEKPTYEPDTYDVQSASCGIDDHKKGSEQTGDADFYVSTSVEKPTYEPDTYDVQSASCGID
ncbi:UPF0669 protein C6orf120 homolog [Diaphorina citri]|uniref:UPF0669 protein C6orf120 homolog n=1 Tax=Diaphorina citri TaxID=121845 RepID=A0A1S3D9L1_DIACI|nr:UPF0669 protein C6orf120 homolog [Diaphorina citri]